METPTIEERLITLFERHYNDVRDYCSRRIQPNDADDVAVEVFAVVGRRIDEIEPGKELPLVVRNRAVGSGSRARAAMVCGGEPSSPTHCLGSAVQSMPRFGRSAGG